MVEIRKGNKSLSIPAGALKKFVSAGWEPVKAPKRERKPESGKITESPKNNEDLDKNTEPDEEIEDEEFEEVDPEELALRPLSELDKEELQILAEYKGLDISELSSVKQLRAALKALE